MDPGIARGVLAAAPGAARGHPGSKDSSPRPNALRGAGFSAPAGLSAFAITAGEAEAANLSPTPWITAMLPAAPSAAGAASLAGTRAATSFAASTFSAVVVIFCHHPRISDFIVQLLGTHHSYSSCHLIHCHPERSSPLSKRAAESKDPHLSRRYQAPDRLFRHAPGRSNTDFSLRATSCPWW